MRGIILKNVMEHEKYEYEKGTSEFEYIFYSEGPKGRIKKIVTLTADVPESNIYNLSLSDWDDNNYLKDNYVISNNGDRDKVLFTAGIIAVDFIVAHPGSVVIVHGRTNSRVRLYQMGITRIIDKLDPKFAIEGFLDSEWAPFEKGIKYKAFLLTIKSDEI